MDQIGDDPLGSRTPLSPDGRPGAWSTRLADGRAGGRGLARRVGHPGLSFVNDLCLISSAGIWDSRFGAFFYTNATVVAGLRHRGSALSSLGQARRTGAVVERPGRSHLA